MKKIYNQEEQLENKFEKMSEIKRVDEDKINYIRSGFIDIDRKIVGFAEGEISVWSGLNGSGKSSFLTQQILEYAEQGIKTVLFSGEMQDYVIQNSLIKMVAGKKALKPSKDETYWYLDDENKRKIILSWLDKYIYLYKNEFGTKVEDVMKAIQWLVRKENIKVVILDNLMTLNLSYYQERDKYEAQSNFIKDLVKTAKMLNIHIHIVMHPRKASGFLRKDDISGSADLSNASDNVFIIHRVNKDFKNRGTEILDAGAMSYLSRFDNVIEICKNRRHGVQDVFIGLRFEKETKKFLSEDFSSTQYMKWI